MRLFLIPLFFIIAINNASSQDVDIMVEDGEEVLTDNTSISDENDEDEGAVLISKKYKRLGDRFYKRGKGRGNYQYAARYYEAAYDDVYKIKSPSMNYKLANSYYQLGLKNKAIPFFENYFKYADSSAIVCEDYFYLAESYEYNLQITEAIDNYSYYINCLDSTDTEAILLAENRIEICKKLLEEKNRPSTPNVKNISYSEYADYSPIFNPYTNTILFTSRRPDTKGKGRSKKDHLYYEDVYELIKNKESDLWGEVRNLGKPINTIVHDASIEFLKDSTGILLYRSKRGGDIYIAEFDSKNNTFKKPKRLSKKINTRYNECSASMSADGNAIYFVSNKKKDNYGGYDIFVAQKDENGNWEAPYNIGENINTAYDEKQVFLSVDGKTLYFSSNGYNGWGGFDIYKSELINGQWTDPVNMPYPINTPADEISFSITSDKVTAYLSSSRAGSQGMFDIYEVSGFLKQFPKLVLDTHIIALENKALDSAIVKEYSKYSSENFVILKGFVRNNKKKPLLTLNIRIVDNQTKRFIKEVEVNKRTGEYYALLPSNIETKLILTKNDKEHAYEYFKINKNNEIKEIEKHITLNNVIKTDTKHDEYTVKKFLNIANFNTASAVIKNESFYELDNIVDYMKTYPTLRAEISGHTDNVGSRTGNLKLSQKRAEAVLNYIAQKGISKSRLTANGYGSSKPLATNKTEEGRNINRRVEIVFKGQKSDKEKLILKNQYNVVTYENELNFITTVYNYNAIKYIFEDNIEKAEAYLKQGFSYTNKNATIVNNLGVVYFLKGQYEQALASFIAAQMVNPDCKVAASNIAITKQYLPGELKSDALNKHDE